MPLDRSPLHDGFRTYLANAEAASGKTYEDFASLLAKFRARETRRASQPPHGEDRAGSWPRQCGGCDLAEGWRGTGYSQEGSGS
jgi:hypothetical protein